MVRFLLRLLINAAALWVAAYLVDGITLTSDLLGVLLVALVFGVINALIKPLLKLIALPFLILTLGLFTLVINALMLLLTSALTESLSVDGFWTALIGSIIISVVSIVLSAFIGDED